MNRLLLIGLCALLLISCSGPVQYISAQTKMINHVDPLYPIQAARNSTEGFVRVSFDINQNGIPENIEVIEQDPIKTFAKVATEAVAQWKYEPLIVNGEAVAQENVSVQLDFKLSDYLGG